MVGQLTQHDPRRIGPFEVLGRLGAGGMGLVYLARSASGRRVAIKTVRSELAEDQLFRVRFTREVEAARAVSGFYTAAVVDADPRAAVPWLATAYVPAPSLEEIVSECGPLPAQAVRWLAAGIAEALQSIHGAGLVHRDLKPSNVLVVEDGPRVIDFGIASGVSNTRLTMTNVAVGTPAYMSPEQARDSRSVNGASDVFSLASTLVFAATGHPPYHGGNPVETVFMLLRERPDLSGLPDELLPLIESLMEHKPDDRPSPADLQAQLAPYLFAAGDDGGSASAWLPPGAVAMIETRRGRTNSPGPPRQNTGGGWGGAEAPPSPPPSSVRPPPSPVPPSRAHEAPQGPPAQPSGSAPMAPPPMPSMPPPPLPSTPPPPTNSPASPAPEPPPMVPPPGEHQGPDWARPPTAHQQAAVPSPNTAHPGQMHQPGSTADHPMARDAGEAAPRWRPWRFRMNNDLWGSPTVAGGALYVTSLEVHALDVATGRRRFRTREVAWSMAVTGGVVLASDGPSLYALDAAEGSDRWRVPTDGWIYALSAERGTVITASRGGLVQAWEAGNGEQLWELSGAQSDFESQDAAPVLRDGVVYAWGEGQLYVLEARTGSELWRYPVGDTSVTGGVPVRVTPTDQGVVYVAAGSRVLALDAASGAERWRFDAPAAILCPPTHQPAGGRDAGLYFTDYLGTVYALDVSTGDDRWRIATESRQSTEPVVVSDGLVHLGSGTAMYTLDAVSGTPRWRFAAGEAIVGSPVVSDGRLHFGSEDHCLYTLDAVSGRLSWKLETGGAITGTPAASGGMVFACSKDHCVYALDAARGTRQS
ncbi:PQQ-binding-like beta-propeller repeat protein [Streptomyces profundus]|uniref:outer membrane protein assembly factor BamB family protein n=1 Tax=Streptomyces profundus TaxID=2867410 RepID=UPI001D16B0FE|nr:PQQ-binding-like beta-propeller repeat protein [Streptomyces sp. MA3_2.13]UED85779.1 PQQ-binding-like beta-propeller repeat protein [Streptomyces sp. MA3_2.13]